MPPAGSGENPSVQAPAPLEPSPPIGIVQTVRAHGHVLARGVYELAVSHVDAHVIDPGAVQFKKHQIARLQILEIHVDPRVGLLARNPGQLYAKIVIDIHDQAAAIELFGSRSTPLVRFSQLLFGQGRGRQAQGRS